MGLLGVEVGLVEHTKKTLSILISLYLSKPHSFSCLISIFILLNYNLFFLSFLYLSSFQFLSFCLFLFSFCLPLFLSVFLIFLLSSSLYSSSLKLTCKQFPLHKWVKHWTELDGLRPEIFFSN